MNKALLERERLVKELGGLKKDEGIHLAEKSRFESGVRSRRKRVRQSRLKFNKANKELDIAKAWNRYLTREKTLNEDNRVLKELSRTGTKLNESKANLEKIKKKLEKIRLPNTAEWKAIRDLDARIAVAKASRRMEVKIHDPSTGLDVSGDGKAVEESGEASEKIENPKGGKLLIEVKQAMDGESPSNLKQEKKELLKELGADSTSELQQRQLDANELETKISGLKETIDTLPDEGFINEIIGTYQLRVEEKVEKPKGAKPKGDLSENIIRLEERKRLAEEDKKSKHGIKIEAFGKLRSAEGTSSQRNHCLRECVRPIGRSQKSLWFRCRPKEPRA